jgi:hypothetical protein
MNPDPFIPLLDALFEDDDAWRAGGRETRARANACLRRRRCWRKLRAAATVIALAAGVSWFVGHGAPPRRLVKAGEPGFSAAGGRPAAEPIRLRLALDVSPATDRLLTACAYDPLPQWTLRCEPLASPALSLR